MHLRHFRDHAQFIEHRIQEVINEDVIHSRALFVSRTQQCFAVKTGIDGYLDIAREVFCSTSEGMNLLLIDKITIHKLRTCKLNPCLHGLSEIWENVWCRLQAIHELAKIYREELNLPNLKMPFNSNRGFYISFPEKDLQGAPVPQIFNQVFWWWTCNSLGSTDKQRKDLYL